MSGLALILASLGLVLIRSAMTDQSPMETIGEIWGRATGGSEAKGVPFPGEFGGGEISPELPGNVERWRPLVAAYFPAEAVETALRVIRCESGGDPTAVNPQAIAGRGQAMGLFQHMSGFWAERSKAAGIPNGNILSTRDNVLVASYLYRRDGWSHWAASQSCWDTAGGGSSW